MLHRKPFPLRLARSLILDVHHGRVDQAVAVLAELGRHQPQWLVDLAVAVALQVDPATVAATTDGAPSTSDAVFREAHRLHDRDVRIPWVLWGERAYQRARTRRRRQRG